MLIFISLNILIIYCSFLIVYKALRIEGAVDSLLAIFVTYLSWIILTELILGVLNVLYLKNLIILNAAIFFIIYLFTKNKRTSFVTPNLAFYFQKLLGNKLYIFIFSVIFSFALVKILINLFNPPFGWDSISYHFTFAVEWLKHGNLNIPPNVFDDPSPSYYPINGSLFYLWLMLPFKSVFMADLGQVPFFIISIIATYGIAQKIGLNKKLSFYSAMLFMLIPNFFKQLQIAYVDIMVASLLLICINYLFLLDKNFNLPNILVYSLSLGLLVGTKTTAVPYTVLLIIPFIVIYFKNIRKINLVLIVAFCFLACGGFSYFRNFLETGNPLYPLDFKIFNIHIFKGVMDKATYDSHTIAADYYLSKALFHEGLSAQGLLLIFPAMFLALPVAVIKIRKKLSFNLIYFLIFPLLLYLAYRFIIPLPNLRYLYALMGIDVVLGFYILDMLRARKNIVDILVFICVLASLFGLAKKQELISSILFTALIFFLLIAFLKNKIYDSLNKRQFVFLLSLIVLCALFGAERFYKINEYPRYYKMVKYSGFWPDATKAWDWLNNNTSADNIAYVGRPVPFPLYGSGFKNNVYYVSVNKVDPIKIHFLKKSHYSWGIDYEGLHKNLAAAGNYRSDADYFTWLENLEKRNISYLFVYSLHQIKGIEFSIEDQWAQSHPDKFRPVFTNTTIHIYKIT